MQPVIWLPLDLQQHGAKMVNVAVQDPLELFRHAKLSYGFAVSRGRLCSWGRLHMRKICAKDRISYVVDWWQGSATAIPHTGRTCDMSFKARLSPSGEPLTNICP